MPNWRAEFKKKMANHKPWDSWILTEEFESRQLQKAWHTYVQKHLFASFKCSSCSHSWKSAQVTITFYMQLSQNILGQASGQVKMKIFRQKCRVCRNVKYEEPSFCYDTVQVILHNLVQKVLANCYGEVSRSSLIYDPVAEDILEGPHERDHCEACEWGFCVKGARSASLGQVWWPEAGSVRPASLVPSREQAGSWWSCSKVACFLVAGMVLVIISFLLDSVH